MDHRVLGKTGHSISVLGLGAAPLANPARCATDDDALEVIHRALDRGVTFIDTAPLYGQGESERRIGRALRVYPAADRCVVATKVGFVPETFDYSAAATIASVRASQARLGLDQIPLVQVHELRAEIYDQIMGPTGALAGLERLRADGSIGQIGVTGSDLLALERAVRTGTFATLLIWRHLHLLDATGLGVVRAAAEQGMGVIVGTPFASGILATGNRPDAPFLYEPASAAVRTRVAALERLCAAAGVSLRAVALQWLLRLPGVTTLIAGAETPDQINSNLAALAETIPASLWERLDAIQSGV